ncbi:rho-related GTP-binding protein RhoQ-like [Saccostrea echinata]|uniref:rho-related GTP-binding protein RhoQ-like n=1 Tax=Saccostrea echinata TaxID=191078 RepID=UPI002A81A304|nr:rho-related GTP-binding protein RhoQ-like [Saccostrea echinata]
MVVSKMSVGCSVVGDGMVGKSSLIQTFVNKVPSEGYLATVVENFVASVSAYGDHYLVNITDFGGEHQMDFLRTTNKNRDVFVVCYSVVDRESFRNAKGFWIPSIKNLNKRQNIILVATHVDLREGDDPDHVTFDEGFELCKLIGGKCFTECSSKDKVRIHQVFESVVSTALAQKKGLFNVIKRITGR